MPDPRAKNIEALPAWHPARTTIKLSEVPVFLKRIYNVPVSYGSVLRWAREGVIRRSDGKRIFLVCRMLGRWRFVEKTDLITFLEQ